VTDEIKPLSKRGGRREGAGRKPNTQNEDIASLIEALRPVRVGRGNYTRQDRYRDFSRVFHGTDEGRRVLAQIIDACEGQQLLEGDLNNHALLAARAWSRRIGALISAWASVPPPKDETPAQG
jgi:hypothetical protein